MIIAATEIVLVVPEQDSGPAEEHWGPEEAPADLAVH